MKEMSVQYQEAMKFPFRNRWLMNLYIGFIQERFQETAQVKIEPSFSFLSNNANEYLFSNTELDQRTATFEQDMFKADGSSIFTDEKHTFSNEIKSGVISDKISDAKGNLEFEMTFTSKQGVTGLKGLTLYFIETKPTSLTIKAYKDGSEVFTKDYTNNLDVFESFDVFGQNADTLKIIIHKIDKPYARFRLRHVVFGVGVTFDNKDFMDGGGTYRETFDICSVYLPTKEVSLQLDNTDEKYNIDRNGSIVNLATVGQDISLSISYVHDDGHIEVVPSERMELESFDVSPTSVRIRAVDFLRNENKEIEIQPEQFTPDMTLYDLAMIVKQSIQNPTFTLVLDDSLKDIKMKPTYIKTACKNALMMIAGSARCMMELVDDGLKIKRTTFRQAVLTFKSDNSAPYSNLSQLTDTNKGNVIATFEKDYVRADGNGHFADHRPVTKYKVGYVSETISEPNGTFKTKPYFDAIASEIISVNQFELRFDDCTPKSITIQTYSNDVLKDTYELNDLRTKNVVITHNFDSFNRMRIIVNSIYDSQKRVRITHMSYGQRVYELDYSGCREKPLVKIENNIRNIIVNYHQWGANAEGNEEVMTKSVSVPCNDTGMDIEYENIFITTEQNAKDVAEWLREYYASQIFYEIPLVGDPSLQVNDVVRIPDRYNDNILGNIEMNEITFSGGGIGGKIRARREDAYVARTKAGLATY